MAESARQPGAATSTETAAPGLLEQIITNTKQTRARSRPGSRQEPCRAGVGRHGHVRPQSYAHLRQGGRGDRRKMSAQLNAIMHDPEFQKLEGTWRGLHYLVQNSRDRHLAQDPRAERQQARAGPGPEPGGRVRPEPDLQEDLRERVRHARRRALRRADRRLRMDQPSGRRRDAAADVQRRRRRLRARSSPRPAPACSASTTGPSCPSRATSTRSSTRSSTPSGELPRQRGLALRHPGHAARARPPALRRGDQADRRVRLRGSADRTRRQGAGDGRTSTTAG